MEFEESLEEDYNDVGGWYSKVVLLLVNLLIMQIEVRMLYIGEHTGVFAHFLRTDYI